MEVWRARIADACGGHSLAGKELLEASGLIEPVTLQELCDRLVPLEVVGVFRLCCSDRIWGIALPPGLTVEPLCESWQG